MSQTPQQIRLGGIVALSIAALTTILFGILALAEHSGRFILSALGPILISAALGVFYTTQAERMAQTIAARASLSPNSLTQVQSLRSMGQVFLAVGALLVIGFTIVAFISQNAIAFLAALAPGIIFGTMGLLYTITSPPAAK